MITKKGYKLTRVKSDYYGNPRYVVHFLAFVPSDIDAVMNLSLMGKFDYALSLAKKYGGKKYRGKDFGGGIVFQCYNTKDLIDFIDSLHN